MSHHARTDDVRVLSPWWLRTFLHLSCALFYLFPRRYQTRSHAFPLSRTPSVPHKEPAILSCSLARILNVSLSDLSARPMSAGTDLSGRGRASIASLACIFSMSSSFWNLRATCHVPSVKVTAGTASSAYDVSVRAVDAPCVALCTACAARRISVTRMLRARWTLEQQKKRLAKVWTREKARKRESGR